MLRNDCPPNLPRVKSHPKAKGSVQCCKETRLPQILEITSLISSLYKSNLYVMNMVSIGLFYVCLYIIYISNRKKGAMCAGNGNLHVYMYIFIYTWVPITFNHVHIYICKVPLWPFCLVYTSTGSVQVLLHTISHPCLLFDSHLTFWLPIVIFCVFTVRLQSFSYLMFDSLYKCHISIIYIIYIYHILRVTYIPESPKGLKFEPLNHQKQT